MSLVSERLLASALRITALHLKDCGMLYSKADDALSLGRLACALSARVAACFLQLLCDDYYGLFFILFILQKMY